MSYIRRHAFHAAKIELLDVASMRSDVMQQLVAVKGPDEATISLLKHTDGWRDSKQHVRDRDVPVQTQPTHGLALLQQRDHRLIRDGAVADAEAVDLAALGHDNLERSTGAMEQALARHRKAATAKYKQLKY